MFDGVLVHIAGGKRGGDFNQRFGQPSASLHPTTSNAFRFNDTTSPDPVTGRSDGLLELLREQDAGDIVVFGGGIIPDADIAELTSRGVAKIFTPGASTTDIVSWVNETLAARHAA